MRACEVAIQKARGMFHVPGVFGLAGAFPSGWYIYPWYISRCILLRPPAQVFPSEFV